MRPFAWDTYTPLVVSRRSWAYFQALHVMQKMLVFDSRSALHYGVSRCGSVLPAGKHVDWEFGRALGSAEPGR